jgi:hypothetical protein
VGRDAEQRAANESFFRRENEKLEHKVAALTDTGERNPFLCECDARRCTAVVLLTLPEYEAVRSKPRQFVLVPGHNSPPDRVVEENEGFIVVEKTGEEGRLVEAQDPRA